MAATNSLEIQLLEFETLLHAPYSMDLALMDFTVFPLIKSQLRGITFRNFTKTILIISGIESDWYSKVYDKWVDRQRKCVGSNGEHPFT
jgi:hypothetical protein